MSQVTHPSGQQLFLSFNDTMCRRLELSFSSLTHETFHPDPKALDHTDRSNGLEDLMIRTQMKYFYC